MTAIDFPNSPTTNQTFTSGSTTWKYDGSKWKVVTSPSNLSSATPDALTPDQTGAAGTSSDAARADHAHEILTASASTITGTNTEGTSTSFVRADHDHAFGSKSVPASALALGPTYETSLPSSPADGQEIYYAANATNGVIWHLRYRSGSSSSYKWEFLGGSNLSATILTSETRTSSTFGDLTTVGPSVTAPLAGDYQIAFGVTGTHASAGGLCLASIYAGTTASDDDSVAITGDSVTTYDSPARTIVKTGLAASATVKVQYRSDGSTGTFFRRWLVVRPVRVG